MISTIAPKEIRFGTIIKNESDEQLPYRVADWGHVTEAGETHPIKTRSE